MRSLQHVLWRGAIALALVVASSAGALTLPQPRNSACIAHPLALATSATVASSSHTAARC